MWFLKSMYMIFTDGSHSGIHVQLKDLYMYKLSWSWQNCWTFGSLPRQPWFHIFAVLSLKSTTLDKIADDLSMTVKGPVVRAPNILANLA